ncbi:hypothetical protein [Actinoplanes sp. NPDC026623]|uniref:hypothetical protein n=1 Tax=Actinoplanes sp. NPDC026623 TaxID=3155610 RepID=UPI0033E0CBC4
MMWRRHHHLNAEAAAMLAAVASESLPYTDPRAGYPAAATYRATRTHDLTPTYTAEKQHADGDAAADEM